MIILSFQIVYCLTLFALQLSYFKPNFFIVFWKILKLMGKNVEQNIAEEGVPFSFDLVFESLLNSPKSKISSQF